MRSVSSLCDHWLSHCFWRVDSDSEATVLDDPLSSSCDEVVQTRLSSSSEEPDRTMLNLSSSSDEPPQVQELSPSSDEPETTPKPGQRVQPKRRRSLLNPERKTPFKATLLHDTSSKAEKVPSEITHIYLWYLSLRVVTFCNCHFLHPLSASVPRLEKVAKCRISPCVLSCAFSGS